MTKKVIIARSILKYLRGSESFLDRGDITVFPAASNEAALALHRKEHADVIVARLRSRGLDGETFCSLIRDDPSLRKVSIILVCPGSEAGLEESLRCRANAFVASPVDPAGMLEEIQRLLLVAERRTCRIPLTITISGSVKKIPFVGLTENISTAGLFFRSAVVLSEGDMVLCSFSLDDGAPLTVKAEVTRVVEPDTEGQVWQYGVAFVGLNAQARSGIEAFIGCALQES